MLFEYIDSVEDIERKYPHIICKFCNQPLTSPIICTECYDFMCYKCPTLDKINRCCENANMNTGDLGLINGKGLISKILEELRVYCVVNKNNGCKWIGTRKEYLEHQNKCNKKYKNCVYGCDKLIKVDDINHLDSCDNFKHWINNNLDEQMSVFMKYTKHKLEQLTLMQKTTRIRKEYVGEIIANLDDNNIPLMEIKFPEIDSFWNLNIHCEYDEYILDENNNKFTLWDFIEMKIVELDEIFDEIYDLVNLKQTTIDNNNTEISNKRTIVNSNNTELNEQLTSVSKQYQISNPQHYQNECNRLNTLYGDKNIVLNDEIDNLNEQNKILRTEIVNIIKQKEPIALQKLCFFVNQSQILLEGTRINSHEMKLTNLIHKSFNIHIGQFYKSKKENNTKLLTFNTDNSLMGYLQKGNIKSVPNIDNVHHTNKGLHMHKVPHNNEPFKSHESKYKNYRKLYTNLKIIVVATQS